MSSPSKRRLLRSLLPLVAAVALLCAPAAVAGQIPLAWDAVADPDLAGYRVYYGTSPGGPYDGVVDVGNVTSHTLAGLQDCQRHYVVVKAYDTGGLESATYSNELSGLPTPAVTAVAPARGEQGQTLDVTVSGNNFDAGATIAFGNPSILVQTATRTSCVEIRATIAVGAAAVPGWGSLDAVNPDGSYARIAQGFEVVASTPPAVTAVTPAAGATGVPVDVRPTVTFSEIMNPATITAANVQLRDAGGSAAPQAAGSPSLDATGTVATIVPAASLAGNAAYRIHVVSGSGGVRDLLGTPMAADYDQNPAFTTGAAPDTTPPTVVATSPADGSTGAPLGVQPTVTFSEAMSAGTITPSRVRLLAADGSAVPQAAGSPSLDATGKIATIVPASPLGEHARYRIEVVGGPTGVKDLAGNAMAATYRQDPGFETQNLPPGDVTNARRVDRK